MSVRYFIRSNRVGRDSLTSPIYIVYLPSPWPGETKRKVNVVGFLLAAWILFTVIVEINQDWDGPVVAVSYALLTILVLSYSDAIIILGL